MIKFVFKASLLILLVQSWNAYSQMSQSAAFDSGKASGALSNVQAIYDMVTMLKGGEVVKDFSTTPPAQSSYWDGKDTLVNTLITGGSNKVTDCSAAGLSASDPREKQHCEAVNSIVNHSATKPTNLIKSNDPLILKGKAITANPEAIAGVISQSYSSCTNKTLTTPAPSVIQTCEEYGELANEVCSTGTQIKLDPDYFYKCLETIKTPATSTCTYGRSFVVDADTNYQCNKTVQGIKTSTCDKTAVITVEGTGPAPWACMSPGSPILTLVQYPNYRGDTKAISTGLYCTATPNTYRVSNLNGVGPPTVYVTANGPASYASSVNAFGCLAQQLWASVTCSGSSCTLNTSMTISEWLLDSKRRCKTEYRFSSGNSARTFTAPSGPPTLRPRITWQNNCASFEAASL